MEASSWLVGLKNRVDNCSNWTSFNLCCTI